MRRPFSNPVKMEKKTYLCDDLITEKQGIWFKIMWK